MMLDTKRGYFKQVRSYFILSKLFDSSLLQDTAEPSKRKRVTVKLRSGYPDFALKQSIGWSNPVREFIPSVPNP